MQVLKVLSDIWKSGAEIYRDDKDGQLGLKNHQLIPAETMKAAEQVFPQIDEWFRSWESETAINKTMMKIVHQFCGWQRNDTLNNWLCDEVDYLLKFDDWLKMLDRNGWKDIYVDFRPFQTDESNKLANEIYERAMAYVKKGA
ncbi:TPA: hypothetical protein NJY08_004385 [Salmonella enterica subsp. enterica serovar Typhi str. AG3]|nr:hypothetical protein [Salmonella enterica subsp. enterica serovar Typhi str. AG3]